MLFRSDFDFNTYVRLLSDFANNDLSAFYFDIRKDSLYCDAATSTKRRACRTILDILFHALVRYAAPVLVFTSEEVWGTRYPDAGSVHLLEWPELPTLAQKASGWEVLRELRSQITESIEPLRKDKTIGSSLEAAVKIFLNDEELSDELITVGLTELAIVASVDFVIEPSQFVETLLTQERPSVFRFEVTKTTHRKCGRCWRHLPEVSADGALCDRCSEVVNG